MATGEKSSLIGGEISRVFYKLLFSSTSIFNIQQFKISFSGQFLNNNNNNKKEFLISINLAFL